MKNNNIIISDNDSKDLQDSPQDKSKMQPEIILMDLPGVEDIPGQQNIVPAPMGELSDTTVSSAGEEGDDIFDDHIDKEIREDPDSNVTPSEKRDLRIAANDLPGDDENLRKAALDSTDDDGAPLNEGGFGKNISAADLDVPGADLDDEGESIGEEDEENNEYSLGGDDNEDAPRDDI